VMRGARVANDHRPQAHVSVAGIAKHDIQPSGGCDTCVVLLLQHLPLTFSPLSSTFSMFCSSQAHAHINPMSKADQAQPVKADATCTAVLQEPGDIWSH
jgi:hypothetical protein